MRGRRAGLVAAIVTALIATASPASADIEATVRSMTLRQKVGQLVMFSVQGLQLSSAEADVIRRHRLGGVILFASNYSNRQQLTALTSRIQTVTRRASGARVGALISVDQEGGVVKRFKDMPPWRSAPELGRIGSNGVARNEGRATGSALRAAGVNVDLAPVADLDIGPEHVMRSRSFGSRPKRVARLATSFALGLQDRRVVATLKHFPGLGGADRNSDYGPAYVRRTRWQLRHIDIVPFRRAINEGVRMVMLSHAIYPNDGGRRPASLSRYIAELRLRRDLGFEGLSISDAIDAMTWWYGGSFAKTCRGTIDAGVDIALLASGVHAAAACAEAIRRGVRSGAISRSHVDAAVTRVLRAKRWLRVYVPA